MRNWDNVRELLSRYYEGETSLQEEKELKEALQVQELPQDLLLEAQLLGWHRQEQQLTAPFTEQQLLRQLPLEDQRKTMYSWAWKVAAAVALLVVGFMAGKLTESSAPQLATAPMAHELTAVRQEVAELKTMLQNSTATTGQRLQAVTVAAEAPEADAELLMALINTMHFDDNVNVRLAAVEALLNYRQHPQVRQALIHSLSIQTDPNVQLMLIQGLTQMQEKEAVPQMEKLLQKEELQQVVRQQLQESIAILI